MKIKLLAFILCIQKLAAFKLDQFEKHLICVNADLVKATYFIIDKALLKADFNTIDIITVFKNPFDATIMSFKDALLTKNNENWVYQLDGLKEIQNIRSRLNFYNIFLLDSNDSFRELYEKMTPERFNYRGKYLLVFIKNTLEEHDEIFSLMWAKGIINVDILYGKSDENKTKVQLETFLPHQENACGNTSRVVLDTLKGGDFNIGTTEIFPNKVQNLYGCELRMVTFDRCPASCVEMVGKEATVKGFDIAILDLIAERLNFKLSKKILLGSEQWGHILPNGTTAPKGNAIERILNNKSDIAIGNYLLRPNRVNIMENSLVYYSFPVLFAIPAGKRYSAFEKLIKPFGLIVWIMLLITLGIGLLVILLLNWKLRMLRSFVYGRGIENPVINM